MILQHVDAGYPRLPERVHFNLVRHPAALARIAALAGGALGGAWVVASHVSMTAVGLTGLPGLAIVKPGALMNYLIGIVIAFAAAFLISLIVKYKTEATS